MAAPHSCLNIIILRQRYALKGVVSAGNASEAVQTQRFVGHGPLGTEAWDNPRGSPRTEGPHWC